MNNKDLELVVILLVKKKRNKYEVFTSIDESGLLFTEEELVVNRIIKGASFTKEAWNKIKDTHEQSLIYEKVLKYLTFKPRTIKETINYLKENNTDEEITKNLIDKLIKLDFLNDERYASNYVDSSIRMGKGPVLISHELHQKGINDELIKKSLLSYTEELQIDTAYQLSVKHLKLISKHPKRKQKELLSQKLIRSGFNYSIINKIIPLLEFNDDNLEQLRKDYEKILKKTTDKNKIIQHLLQKGYEYSQIKEIMNIHIYEE